MIYLDNAATTLYKPDEVYIRSNEVFRLFGANAGRGGHKPSIDAAEIIYSCRERLAAYFGCDKPENIIFTSGCTDALNILIKGLFSGGDHIIATAYEHNSVLRPLEFLKKTRACEYSTAFPKNGQISTESLEKEIKPNTKAIIMNHVSNVTGSVQDIEAVGLLCKRRGLLFIVDGAQSAGTQITDMKKMNISYLCCAGHKGLYGPQGIGVLCIAPDSPLPVPLRHGGTGSRSLELDQPSDMPEYLESGTLAVQNIAALEKGIDFVQTHGVLAHEIKLADMLKEELSHMERVRLYSPKSFKSGVVSFNIGDADSSLVAEILDKQYSICARGGFHCAPLVHKYLGTENQGAVRFSLSYFNTEADISGAVDAVKEIAAQKLY